MAWSYWDEVRGPKEHKTVLTDIGHATLKRATPDTQIYRWDFRLLRPTFMKGAEEAIFKALEPRIFIHEQWHDLLGIVGLEYEEDVRNTVFSALTLPPEGTHRPALKLIRWPTDAFVRMVIANVPAREITRIDGAVGQRRKKQPSASQHTKLIGLVISISDIPYLEET